MRKEVGYKNFLNFFMEDDWAFYEKFLTRLPDEEIKRFFEKHPEYMKDDEIKSQIKNTLIKNTLIEDTLIEDNLIENMYQNIFREINKSSQN